MKKKNNENSRTLKLNNVVMLTIFSILLVPVVTLIVSLALAPFALNTEFTDLLGGTFFFTLLSWPIYLVVWYGIKSIKMKKSIMKYGYDVSGIAAQIYGFIFILIGIIWFSMTWSFLIGVFVCHNLTNYACTILEVPTWPFKHLNFQLVSFQFTNITLLRV